MKITSFEFSDYNWTLDKVYFSDQSLIVGRNAVGKSKTLASLILFAKFLRGEVNNATPNHWCKAEFLIENNITLYYTYAYKEGSIEQETLVEGDKSIIKRNKDHAVIGDTTVNPPTNKLCIQIQRDTTKNPEFEAIMQWAEQLRGFSFSDLSTRKSYLIPSMFNENIDFCDMYEQIDKVVDKKDFVLNKMREMDYQIESIEPVTISDKFNIVFLRENGVNTPLFSATLSNGMLRVFYIFSYIAFISLEKGAKTLLIDDLGEGLDFSRSKKLSKILFDYSSEHDIQLIVTSNDNFLMNAVSLDHWVILQRNHEITSAVSEETHPELFKKFRRMGLNNFDLLSTDFIFKNLEKEQQA